ncbi:hypothetical protein KCG48_08255 [Proteiniclasticum sp. BAD-10]|uniref:Uncharacterized protein n=1 Tax=Proteiniclasticum sediminis TaxID=2804028 RepID=A0A941CP75_9CLOT|nr:hypothetical protein [Proteiniclasticum sediminis]MBR0576335.1 hypothetical protein [Proteiniclasticum sediminis]
MKFVKSTVGFAIAGMFVMSVWGDWVGKYGNLGGWFAAVAIIGPMWFLNHYIGLIQNDGDHAFVDMAWGIAWTGLMRDVFGTGENTFDFQRLISSLPTIACLTIGALLAAIAINAFNKKSTTK